jgi:hypothetical protein
MFEIDDSRRPRRKVWREFSRSMRWESCRRKTLNSSEQQFVQARVGAD